MKIFLIACCVAFMFNGFSQSHSLIVGTYDSPKSAGIYVYDFNSSDGSAKEISHIKTSNPSYICISPNKEVVYAVNENADKNGKGGSVTSFAFDRKSGTLSQINSQSSEGSNPCHIITDKTGKWLIVGNYSSGNFSVLPVKGNGELLPASQAVQMQGKSIDSLRQNSPHVHSSLLTAKGILYVADLGTDKIMNYIFDEKKGIVKPSVQNFVNVVPGSGPRHMDISADGKYLYVVQELSGMVTLFSTRNKTLKKLQTISTLPANFKGAAGSADIHISPDGNFLYASNRAESNTIAIYKINQRKGLLSLIGHQSTLGLAPRNFNFDPSGKYLLAANQNSDEIVIFERNKITGLLNDTGKRIIVGKPVCLKWL